MRLFKPILLGGLGWIAMLGASVAFAQVSYRLQEPRAAPLPGQPPIDVVFSLPADSYRAHSGIVVLTITNQSDQVIYMPIWLTPTSGIAPKETELPRRLMNPVLDVVNKDGKFSPYIGWAYKLIVDEDHPENNAWLYQELRPGQVISKEVDVAKDYDVTGGGYFKLSYMQFYGGPDVVLRDGNPLAYKAWSNELEIWINPNISTLGSFGALDPDDVSLMQCTPRQSAVLWGANSMAHVWLQESVWKSFPLYKVIWGFDSVNAVLNQDDKYIRWFGQPFNNLEPVEDYKERGLMSPPVWGHPDFRPLRLAYAAMNRAIR